MQLPVLLPNNTPIPQGCDFFRGVAQFGQDFGVVLAQERRGMSAFQGELPLAGMLRRA